MRASTSAWALLVVSSEQQSETLAHQRAWAKETASEQGWELTRTFEGVSTGRAGPRRLLTELIAALKALPPASRPAWVLMIRADRVGRGRLADSQIALHALVDLGLRIWTRDGGELKLDSATDQIIAAVKAGLATLENEVRSDKQKAVVKRKREAGLPVGPQRPYGLRLDPATKRDLPAEPQADAVREAYRLRSENMGYHAIGQRLYAIAAPHVFKNGRVAKIQWSTTMVSRLLTNRAYVAAGVVDELTFERVQRIKVALQAVYPPRPARHPWPLSGALRCWCGRAMSAATGGKNPIKRVRYYTCRNSAAHEGFRFRRVRADAIEAQFLELLENLEAHPGLVARYRSRDRSETPAMLRRSLRAVTRRLDELGRLRDAAWAMHERGALREADLQERLDALAAERDELEGKAALLGSEIVIASAQRQIDRDAAAVMAKAAQRYRRGTVAQQRRIAIAVAAALGGLCAEADGKLVARPIAGTERGVVKRIRGASGVTG